MAQAQSQQMDNMAYRSSCQSLKIWDLNPVKPKLGVICSSGNSLFKKLYLVIAYQQICLQRIPWSPIFWCYDNVKTFLIGRGVPPQWYQVRVLIDETNIDPTCQPNWWYHNGTYQQETCKYTNHILLHTW